MGLANASVDSCAFATFSGTTTGAALTQIPPAGDFYWYLVVATTCAGDGSAGNGSFGPRVVNTGGDCSPATCTDGLRNGTESDVDCGGSCPGCATGKQCCAGNDCGALVCQLETCAAPTCTDLVKNGNETDVDCGGGTCPACGTGHACIASSDCQGHVCTGNVCSPAANEALLRVHYPAGGHAVKVRGSAGGLSWALGQPMAASGDTYSYVLAGVTAPVEWKPLLDDATWAQGPNYHAAPGQTVDIWPHFTTTQGQVVTLITAFHSTVLGNDRAIYAYLPPGYYENTDATYPVVYMNDGQNLWAAHPEWSTSGATWNVDTAFDAAAGTGTCSAGGVVGWGAQPLGGAPATCTFDDDCPSGQCRTFPEAIVIGVASNANRIYEYTPTTDPGTPGGGGADSYLQMLTGELKPAIDAMLRTRPGVGSTAIAGSSLGGLVSAYAALKRPTVFGLVAELSPSTYWNNDVIVSDVAGTLPAPNRPLIVYVDSGSGAADDQADTDQLANQYLALGYVNNVSFRHVVQSGATHTELYWAERFPGAMQLLLGVR